MSRYKSSTVYIFPDLNTKSHTLHLIDYTNLFKPQPSQLFKE